MMTQTRDFSTLGCEAQRELPVCCLLSAVTQ